MIIINLQINPRYRFNGDGLFILYSCPECNKEIRNKRYYHGDRKFYVLECDTCEMIVTWREEDDSSN